jgi:hypothetical protein
MNRAEILDTAKGHVTVDRAADHGEMEENFGTIAEFWSTYLGRTVSPHDVGAMMTLLKVARIKSNPTHADHWTDGAGYMACGGEIATHPLFRSRRENPTPSIQFLPQNPEAIDRIVKATLQAREDLVRAVGVPEAALGLPYTPGPRQAVAQRADGTWLGQDGGVE